MPQTITVTILATVTTVIELSSPDLEEDSVGFFHQLPEESEDIVLIRLRGKTTADQAKIIRVRSVPTPDQGQGPWTFWTKVGTDHVSPPFPLGTEIRIEIDNNAGAPTVPQGGGHFRVVEEGGGLVIGSGGGRSSPADEDEYEDDPRQVGT